MKVRLVTKDENYTRIKQMLEKGGFEVSEYANLVLKDNCEEPYLLGEQEQEMIPIPYHDILYIESYGRYIYVNTVNRFIRLKNRLYEIEASLKRVDFIRISKSVIVNKTGIQKIIPIINGRFDLMMKNNEKVTVTKSYRHSFKSFLGF
jgi:DNA-binding LytR/AlgR family response regulator